MKIKEEFLERRKEVQTGVQIHLEYEYLLNTDISWILDEIRSAFREEIKIRKKVDKVALTLDVEEIRTDNSIDILLFLGTVAAPYIIERYGPQIIDEIIYAAWQRLHRRGISKKRRVHIRNGHLRRIRGRPGEDFEILDVKGEEIIIEE